METEKKSKRGLIAILASLGIILALSVAYIFMAFSYKEKFFKGTKINGIDVSNMSLSEAEKVLEQQVRDDFSLTIKTWDGKEIKASAEDVGLRIAFDDISAIKEEQGYFNWPIKNGKEAEYTLMRQQGCDAGTLDKYLKGLDIMDEKKQTAPENAYIVKDDEKGYLVVPDTHGSILIPRRVEEAVAKAVKEGRDTVDLEEEQCYEKPSITRESPQIADVMDKIEAYTNAVITYDLGDDIEEVLDSSVSNPWIDIDENGEAYIKTDMVRAYVNGLDEKYSTLKKTREFKTTAGDIVEIDPGNYGYVVDKQAEYERIIEDLTAGKPVKRPICYSAEGYTHNNNDIGDTYVEISITDQHLWYYEDGELILDCDIRTGCTGRGQGTPTGCYEVQNKYEKIVLVGDDYRSPVDYWIGFIGRRFGMHDASWVSSFGGDTYKWAGSHGCVNMPLDSVAELFERVELGVPVVIYWE